MMNTVMLGLLAETSIHPGAGRSMGVVDLPVAREAATDYPVIVGSSLKGALKTAMLDRGEEGLSAQLFGTNECAGQLLVADGRVLLLPVRSLTGAFRWVTCPHLLERFRRDRLRAGLSLDFKVPAVPIDEGAKRPALAAGKGSLFLEEREFEIKEDWLDGTLVEALAEVMVHEEARGRLRERLVILHDDDFAWFARYGLQIQARNVLEEITKRSRNLWYEETLPPETVFCALVAGRTAQALEQLRGLFPAGAPYLQAGGNETVGQGWFAVRVLQKTGGAT